MADEPYDNGTGRDTNEPRSSLRRSNTIGVDETASPPLPAGR